jgi:replicative DNA helicase
MDYIFFEKVLIKFLFKDEKVRDKAMPFLSPKVFEDHKNIQLVKAIMRINETYGKFPSPSDLKLELKNEDVYNRLKEIIDLDVSEYQSDFLLEEIEDFIRKKLIHNVNVDVAVALNNDNDEELKKSPDSLREAIAFSFDTRVGMDFFEEEERLYTFLHSRDRYIPTSISQLNKIVDGGFHEKSLTLFMAETNLGKSLIMASMAVDCILLNKNVLYVTCEMSEDKISERVITNLFDVELDNLRTIDKTKFHEKFENIKQKLKNKLVIKEYPTSSINVNHIRNLLKELEVRTKFKPDIIFIDYIGIMLPSYKNKADNTYLEVKKISEEVRALAVESGLPIVSCTQTNRCLEENTEVIILKNSKEFKIPIKNINVGDFIKRDKDVYHKVNEVFYNKKTECYKITLKSGKVIICSKNHIFPTNNGLHSIQSGGIKVGNYIFSQTN